VRPDDSAAQRSQNTGVFVFVFFATTVLLA
jgi:hypothetical protein